MGELVWTIDVEALRRMQKEQQNPQGPEEARPEPAQEQQPEPEPEPEPVQKQTYEGKRRVSFWLPVEDWEYLTENARKAGFSCLANQIRIKNTGVSAHKPKPQSAKETPQRKGKARTLANLKG